MTQESLTEKLAIHMMRPINDASRSRARLHLLDWLACVAGARESEVAKVATKAEPDILSRAALLGNVLEMDDVHRSSILHPGPAIWPAALSANRDIDGSMDGMLDGCIAGYEATIAIGASFDAAHYGYYHNTSTAGSFGAAAAAGHIFGFEASQYVNAMGNAGSVSGGLWQMRHENVMTKQMHVMHAALMGLWQARMARQGFTGPRFILEGEQGLYAATCEKPKPIELTQAWRIHEVSFKPWGACRHAHPAIDAALEYKRKYGALEGDIHIETYDDAISFCNNPNPQTPHQAKFSIQHAIAIVAEKDVPNLSDFEPDAIAHFAEGRGRISVTTADDITARYPHHFGARVTSNGNSIELTDTLGDPERPLDMDGIKNKLRQLISWGGLPDEEAERAINLCLNGNDARDIHKMLSDWLS